MDFLKAEEKKFTEPRYDDVYFEGVAALDRDAGGEITEQALVVRDPFDPAPLVDLFKQYHHEIDRMSNLAQGLKVVDDETNSTATLMTTQAKKIAQAIEKKRIELKEPYLKVTSVLDQETKGLKDRLVTIQAFINSLITPFLQKKEAERRAAERKVQEEAAKIQKELDDKAEADRKKAADEARLKAIEEGKTKKQAEAEAKNAAAMVEDAPTIVTEAPAEIKVQTDAGSAKLKEEWSFEIFDPSLMPQTAFDVRRKEVIAALSPWVSAQIKAGIREISGVRIYKAVKIQTRTSRTYDKF